jgi:hypothetical protein
VSAAGPQAKPGSSGRLRLSRGVTDFASCLLCVFGDALPVLYFGRRAAVPGVSPSTVFPRRGPAPEPPPGPPSFGVGILLSVDLDGNRATRVFRRDETLEKDFVHKLFQDVRAPLPPKSALEAMHHAFAGVVRACSGHTVERNGGGDVPLHHTTPGGWVTGQLVPHHQRRFREPGHEHPPGPSSYGAEILLKMDLDGSRATRCSSGPIL